MHVRPGQMGMVPGALGVVDFRLARRNVLSEFRRGRASLKDICDAHPELVRAAAEYSRPTPEECPVCDVERLVHVSYVFGPHLPPGGRVYRGPRELSQIVARATQPGQYTTYVVEVCSSCRWNHLVEVTPVPSARALRRSRPPLEADR
jgi:hypothetical protein